MLSSSAVNALVTVLNGLLADVRDDILAPLLGLDCDPGDAFELIPNEEGTCLSGRKLIVEGQINQKIIYTGEVETQSVHSMNFNIPFTAFIMVYAKFENLGSSQDIVVYDPETNGPKTINGYLYDPSVGITVDIY